MPRFSALPPLVEKFQYSLASWGPRRCEHLRAEPQVSFPFIYGKDCPPCLVDGRGSRLRLATSFRGTPSPLLNPFPLLDLSEPLPHSDPFPLSFHRYLRSLYRGSIPFIARFPSPRDSAFPIYPPLHTCLWRIPFEFLPPFRAPTSADRSKNRSSLFHAPHFRKYNHLRASSVKLPVIL